MANVRMPRSQLTFSQQGQVRANLMKTAATIVKQLDDYVKTGTVSVAGRETVMSGERLAAYRLVLDRTVPTLASTEIKRTTALESLTSEQLVGKLAALAQSRPELSKRLQEALGGRVIEGEAASPPTPPAPSKRKAPQVAKIQAATVAGG